MAGEWKRATWAYQPISLSHTPLTIVKALYSFLTQSGWELAPWSSLGTDRHLLRADRRTVQLTAAATGTGGNVAVTKSGANIAVTGMSGGGTGVKATGTVTFSGLPADGDTVTIGDGTLTKTFEFDNNASVGGGNVAVAIGATLIATVDNLVAAILASGLTTVAAPVSTVWRYNGDSPEQACGLRIRYDSGNSRIAISAFIEDAAAGGLYKETTTANIPWYTYDDTAENDLILVGGEDGLWLMAGRDGAVNNLAHLHMAVFKAIPEFQGTKDAKVRLTSQGLAMDLFGSVDKLSSNRNRRFVDNNGSNQNYTANLEPVCARGTSSVTSSSQTDGQRYPIVPRDNLIGLASVGGTAPGASLECLRGVASFGMINSPVDDHFKLAPFWMVQDSAVIPVVVESGSASNNVAAEASRQYLIETRWLRQIARIMAIDQTLIENNVYTDPVTGKDYYCSLVADNGRNARLAVEWPGSGDVVTIPTTPST